MVLSILYNMKRVFNNKIKKIHIQDFKINVKMVLLYLDSNLEEALFLNSLNILK